MSEIKGLRCDFCNKIVFDNAEETLESVTLSGKVGRFGYHISEGDICGSCAELVNRLLKPIDKGRFDVGAKAIGE